MYNKVTNYFLPETVSEACSMLAKPANKAVIIGGGTHIVKTMPADANAIIDLRNMGLSYIKEDAKYLRLGAMVTFTQMLENKAVKAWAGGLLWNAAREVKPQTIRNMGTLGGNIAAQFPYNSFPSVFMALDALVVYAENGKKITAKFREMESKGVFSKLGKKAVLLEFLIPAATKKLKSDFVKFMKPHSARECYAVISTVLSKKGNAVTGLSVAVTSAAAKPLRLEALEKAVNGQKLTEELLDEAIALASKNLNIQEVYKKEVLPVLVKRSVLSAYNN